MTRVVVLIGCLLLITSCGDEGADNGNRANKTTSSENGGAMRTLTKEEAATRAEKHIRHTVAALPVEPSLRLQDDSSIECQEPTDDGPRGRYEVGKTYWLDDLPAERNAEFVDILYEYWVDNGYRVLSDKRSSSDKYVWVENKEDSFRMSVQQSVKGDLSLGAASPCVWPDGAPPSSTDK